jgi:hypothetical protein
METMRNSMKAAIAAYERIPINGLVRQKALDLQCHMGVYESQTMHYRAREANVDFEKGIQILSEVFTALKQTGTFNIAEDIYKLYRKWIVWDGQQIEVLELVNDSWNYSVMRSTERGELFIEVVHNRSAAYWDKLFLVDKEDYSAIETAIQQGNKQILINLADKYRARM